MRRSTWGAVLALALVATPGTMRAEENDPIETLNRGIFWFNDKVDVYVLEPVARGWHFVLPDPVERAVGHFFSNLRFPIVSMNDLLQGKLRDTGVDVWRFCVNTTIGVGGFLDVASAIGLERNEEDFGQTLGRWGVPSGPYLVLPFLGPSSVRDAAGLAGDAAMLPHTWLVELPYLAGARVIETINLRADFLLDVAEAKAAAVDYYAFVRNAYLSRRENLVEDRRGSPGDKEDLYYDVDLHRD